MIDVRNLAKSYAGFPALKGITFRVERGEVVGFLGPNGAGKTTTLRILSGYMPATEGVVTVNGHDVILGSREVRRGTGYLPEDVPLYRDMTVNAFLRYMGGLKEIPREGLGREVDRVAALAGLEPVRSLLIAKCSKGFRQRTGLAQALLGDPPVLLLDEPTSGLDPNQAADVRDLIRDLSGEKTVLLSSHILSEVAQICTRVLIVHEGRLVASGTPGELAGRFGAAGRLHLRLKGEPAPGLLEGAPGVLRVDRGSEPGMVVLAVEEPDRAAPAVARALVDAGVELLELRQESADLETIFRAVTRGDDDDA